MLVYDVMSKKKKKPLQTKFEESGRKWTASNSFFNSSSGIYQF